MSRLIQAMQRIGVPFEVAESGRWVRFEGETCTVYVVEGGPDHHFLTWCERWDDRRVERYLTAEEAIVAGVRRSGVPLRPPLSAAPIPDAGALATSDAVLSAV
ncbi:MAG: hypothetical protein HY331_10180 [Chloroflexi bacterium]|nr:hypothetical protein [Chloroflexota bacterium]